MTKGQLDEDERSLRAQMLEAFLAIEPHDAHVRDRRKAKAEAVAPLVAQSVAERRKMFHSTGISETPPSPLAIQRTSRRIQDPSLTDANFYAERAKKPSDPNIGRVWVEENAKTRIGGLALIRRRLNHHERAAEWFKTAYEQLYGGMAPAIDMAKVRVDTSIMAHDNGAVARLDNGRRLLELVVGVQQDGKMVPPRLAKPATDRIINCVVFGCPAGDLALPGPSGKPSGRAVEREVDLLLDALDQVAEINGYKMRGAA